MKKNLITKRAFFGAFEDLGRHLSKTGMLLCSKIHRKLQTTPKPQLLFFAVTVFGLILTLQIIGYRFRSLLEEKQWQLSKQQLKLERDKAYQAVIEKQQQRKLQNQEDKSKKTVSQPKLLGVNHLYIFFVKPSNTSNQSIQPLINTLTAYHSNNYSSLNSIHTFLHREAKKYSPDYFEVIIDVYPEVATLDINRVGDFSNYWGKDSFGLSRLQDQFATILDKHNLKLDDRHHAIFIFFDDIYIASAESDGSFYESKTFRSFSNQDKHLAYVNAYDFSVNFAPLLVEIVTHETLHLFGASDKYLENEYGCKPEGRGEPEKTPLFPQTTSDIMCGLIEYQAKKFIPAYIDKDQVVINSYTAKEIGWE
ncbi:MAG: hypothetical protein ACOZAN_05255 [Patescibacteria group bacterium]